MHRRPRLGRSAFTPATQVTVCCPHAGGTWSRPATLTGVKNANPKPRKQWAWVHWELPVDTAKFFTASEVTCRAWDESQNTQPATLTWNLLGQGNNCLFRLRLHKEADAQV